MPYLAQIVNSRRVHYFTDTPTRLSTKRDRASPGGPVLSHQLGPSRQHGNALKGIQTPAAALSSRCPVLHRTSTFGLTVPPLTGWYHYAR